MRAPMTRRRLVTLVGGTVVLAALAVWRLSGERTPGSTRARGRPPGAVDEAPKQGLRLLTFSGEIMGTTYRVRARVPPSLEAPQVTGAVHAALARVDAAMSTYKPESELSRLNRAPAGEQVPVSSELGRVLEVAYRVHEQTDGAFDVTVAPLVSAWGFGAQAQATPPTNSELEKLLARVGMRHLDYDPAGGFVEKHVEGMALDLSAIAKGFAVDQAGEALEHLGVRHFMVEVGGEILVQGRPADERPWLLGIERPSPEGRQLFGRLELSEGALATSGDYRSFRVIEGETVSHTLDPRTGRPTPRRTASVSVVRPSAVEADALATALGVLEPQYALDLADQEGWAVMLLLHGENDGFVPKMSASFRRLRFEGLPSSSTP